MIDLNLSPEDSLILLCCCVNPKEKELKQIENTVTDRLNWEYIYKLASLHGVSNLVFKNLEKCGNKAFIPSRILTKLEKEYHKTAFINRLLTREYDSILRVYNKNNIKIMPLKGIAFCKQLYNNIGLRPFTDIDILVEKNDLDNSEKLLKDMSYRKKNEYSYKNKRPFHSIYWRKEGSFFIFLELHWDIDYSDSPFGIKIADVWSRAEVTRNRDRSFYMPSLEDNIILNSFHIVRGVNFDHARLPLKNFCDLSEIIKRDFNKINWQLLTERSKKYKIIRPVFLVLFLLQKLFHVSIPETIGNEIGRTGLKEEMAQTVIMGNIFHSKESDNIFPVSFIRLSEEMSHTGRIKIALKACEGLCFEFKNKYNSDIRRSLIKTVIMLLQQRLKTTLRYIKTVSLAILCPGKTRRLLKISTEKLREREQMNEWIRGIR
jgi:hypothetical protein